MPLSSPREIVPAARLESLPRLAAIAFSARCGAFALDLLGRLPWQNGAIRSEHIPHLERCVERAWRYAAAGAAADVPDRAQRTARADAAAVREWTEVWDDEYIPWTDALRSAIFICDGAGSAASSAECVSVLSETETLLGHMLEDVRLHTSSAAGAQALTRNVEEPRRSLLADFAALEASSRREGWHDGTPVPPEFFAGEPEIDRQIFFAVNELSVLLCELIARKPEALWRVEWRDSERVVSTSLGGCGFDVTLTPPSKDGGRDVVATCQIHGRRKTYYVEIKHWISGKRVQPSCVEAFLELNVRDGTDLGLFLSTTGYTDAVHRLRSEISRQRLRLGTDTKIVQLCQQFVQRRGRATWDAQQVVPAVILQDTL
jgi:hypothetical protein